MNRTLTVAGVLALTTLGSLAADLPARKSPQTPPPPSPLPVWTGFYAGLNAGYSWSASNGIATSTTALSPLPYLDDGAYDYGAYAATAALSASGRASAPMSGFIGGGQLGYNYQFNSSFVAGFETDLQGSGAKGGGGFLNAAHEPSAIHVDKCSDGISLCRDDTFSSISIRRSVNWLGTVRGRLGYLVTPSLLAYATGGFAYGGVSVRSDFANAWTPTTPAPYGGWAEDIGSPGGIGAFSRTLAGWTAGGGLEWMVLPGVSVKAEYLYYNLGAVNSATPWALYRLEGGREWDGGATPALLASGQHMSFDGHVARAGLNYHFGNISSATSGAASAPGQSFAPVWNGFFAGLNAGYGWSGANGIPTLTGIATPLQTTDQGYAVIGAVSADGVASAPMSGFIGGGQFGYNYML
jgi:outer membrane immunogenic protein